MLLYVLPNPNKKTLHYFECIIWGNNQSPTRLFLSKAAPLKGLICKKKPIKASKPNKATACDELRSGSKIGDFARSRNNNNNRRRIQRSPRLPIQSQQPSKILKNALNFSSFVDLLDMREKFITATHMFFSSRI